MRMTQENGKNARQVVGGLEGNIWEDEKELRNLQRNLKSGFTMTNIWKQTNNPLGPLSLSLRVLVSLHSFKSMGPLL